MAEFKGFPEGKTHLVAVPAPFFSELLPHIDHLGELKLTLHFFWRLERMEGTFRFLRRGDLAQDTEWMRGMGENDAQAQTALDEALEKALQRGTLLRARLAPEDRNMDCYFLNSPKGRAALRAIESGQWRPLEGPATSLAPEPKPNNIFQLYEENIGPLTPLIAEALGEAEDTYSAQWVEDAIRIAAERGKPYWRYIEAILDRWGREGRYAGKEKPQDRRDSEEARRRYSEWDSSKS